MISNYYVLVALAREWKSVLAGARVTDAYSQSADELSLVFETGRTEDGPALSTLRMSTAAPLRYLLMSRGSGRAKRNTADVLAPVLGATIEDVDVVDGDRIVRFHLADQRQLQLVLFGSAANGYLLDGDGVIVDAFQSAGRFVGKRVPTRSVSVIRTVEEFVGRWKQEASGALSCGQILSRVEPLFNRFLADEVVVRSDIDTNTRASSVDESVVRTLFDGVTKLRGAFSDQAWIYWGDGRPERLTLFESMQYPDAIRSTDTDAGNAATAENSEAGDDSVEGGDGLKAGRVTVERFDSVSTAVSVFVRRTLALKSLGSEHSPVLKKVSTAKNKARRRLSELERELTETPRAEKYEKYGHILMAQASGASTISNPFVTEDIFDGGEISIPVDTSLTLIDNANRYYEKAKRAKLARESAESRLESAQQEDAALVALYEQVSGVSTLDEWNALVREHADSLRPFMAQTKSTGPDVPFRQFDLGNDYIVWVGRNAKQNELLSSKAARNFDLWFHARGVPGSHVVLRLPHKNVVPDGRVVEAAARIAAYYSKARGGSMVPVIVTEAKFVRKPRGAAPGSVVVERERVLLVDPALPD